MRTSYWTVAQTESQRERVAKDHLERRGFGTYLPRTKQRKLIEPLFPGYIFVEIECSWYGINATIGVVRVLLSGGRPARVRDEIMEEIRAREDHRGIVRLPKREPKIGAEVRIVRGMFCDHVAIYDGQSGKDRERVLLALLGRMVAVNLPPADLQFAS